jgi:uncharacterized protein
MFREGDAMIPQRSWFFLQPPSDLHGLGHSARVMVWAGLLARDTEWLEPVLWAAACHDLRRQDDGSDPRHGFRAGAWVRETLPAMLKAPPAALELIARACDWHVCPDRQSQWDHPSLWLLKDADGLDRARLYDLDPSFLRRPAAVDLVQEAQRLYEATACEQDPLLIWQTAADLGVPVEGLRDWIQRQAESLVDAIGLPSAG